MHSHAFGAMAGLASQSIYIMKGTTIYKSMFELVKTLM